jgi:hypothetical protein
MATAATPTMAPMRAPAAKTSSSQPLVLLASLKLKGRDCNWQVPKGTAICSALLPGGGLTCADDDARIPAGLPLCSQLCQAPGSSISAVPLRALRPTRPTSSTGRPGSTHRSPGGSWAPSSGSYARSPERRSGGRRCAGLVGGQTQKPGKSLQAERAMVRRPAAGSAGVWAGSWPGALLRASFARATIVHGPQTCTLRGSW